MATSGSVSYRPRNRRHSAGLPTFFVKRFVSPSISIMPSGSRAGWTMSTKRTMARGAYSAGSWYPSFITSIFASTEAWPWERSP